MAAAKKKIEVTAPNIQQLKFDVKGTSPLVMHRFSNKASMILAQSTEKATGRKVLPPKDWDALCEAATHRLTDGSYGIPASAFRAALIRACVLVRIHMTTAKMSVWVKEDGYDLEGYPLVRLKGKPEQHFDHVRLADDSTSIVVRPMFKQWSVQLRVCFDADQFSANDVTNLMLRAGSQVGILEGRMFSHRSAGMGWGSFDLANSVKIPARAPK